MLDGVFQMYVAQYTENISASSVITPSWLFRIPFLGFLKIPLLLPNRFSTEQLRKIFLRMTSLAATFGLRVVCECGLTSDRPSRRMCCFQCGCAETHCGIFCRRAEMITIISTLTSLVSPVRPPSGPSWIVSSLSASPVSPARADSKRQVQNWVWVLLTAFSLASLYLKHSLVCSNFRSGI